MGMDSGVNISNEDAPYGGKSAFTQLEHNIVAGYLITAGNIKQPLCCVLPCLLCVMFFSFAVV